MKNVTIQLIKSISLILIFCAAAFVGTAQTINLQLQNDYTNAGTAYAPSLAVGDVNNDGRPDLVTTNRPAAGGDFIAVYLNNGAGGFNAALPAGNNFSARVVALGDFNKDGNLDMAIGTDGPFNGLNIRLGNGTGNFPTGISTGTSADIESISKMAVADFNGDGNLDLAITDVSGYNNVPFNAVKLLPGNGLGGFPIASITSFAVQFGGANDMAVADFNVDGRPDIAVTAPNSNVFQVLLNNGAGGFNAALNTTSNGARRLVSADFNRDCIPDLAVSQSSSNLVSIFLGNGAGGFGSPTFIITSSPAETGLAVGDFNRDRKVDLAIRATSTGAPNFFIAPGNGAGGFGTTFQLTLPVSDAAAVSLAVLDANLDGKADIIVNRQGGFALYHGNSAMFTRTENDFDGDLKADLSVFRPSNGTWYINRSIGGFAQQQWGAGSDKLTPADFDGDGKTDYAVYRPGAPSIAAFYILNSSNNTIRAEQFGQTGDDSSVVGDWDGDGKADPAVFRDSAIGSQNYFFYRGSLNNPNGTVTYVPWGTAADKAVRGDFDGDGKSDAAVFRPSNGTWYILQSSNGQGRAQAFGLSTDRRVPADYDGDGKTDIAVVRPSNNDWYILNSATGAASYRQWGANSDALIPGDYNGDGKTEVSTYRAAEGNWYIPQCADYRGTVQRFGASGDVAVPSAFVP